MADFDNLTPAELIAAAESFEAQAQLLRALAKLRSSNVKSSATLPDDMTSPQLLRRGAEIAKARAAASPDDRFLAAVTVSRWRSLTQYAKHLKVSPASITGWKRGDRPCPLKVAKRVKEDLGLPFDVWPAGVE